MLMIEVSSTTPPLASSARGREIRALECRFTPNAPLAALAAPAVSSSSSSSSPPS